METQDIDKFKIEYGEKAPPIIVLTGTLEEFEKFCTLTRRNTKTAIAVRQGYQIPHYPDLPIVLYGTYWLNTAYDSPEYRDRMHKTKLQELEENNG